MRGLNYIQVPIRSYTAYFLQFLVDLNEVQFLMFSSSLLKIFWKIRVWENANYLG